MIYQTFFAPSDLQNTHPKFIQTIRCRTHVYPGIALFWVITQPVMATSDHCSLRNNPQECSSHLLCGGSLKFNNIQTQQLNVSNGILLTSRWPFTSFDPPWLQLSVYVSHCSRPYFQSLSAGLQGLLLLFGFTVSSVPVRCLGIQGNWQINIGLLVGHGSDTARRLQSSDHSNQHTPFTKKKIYYIWQLRGTICFLIWQIIMTVTGL